MRILTIIAFVAAASPCMATFIPFASLPADVRDALKSTRSVAEEICRPVGDPVETRAQFIDLPGGARLYVAPCWSTAGDDFSKVFFRPTSAAPVELVQFARWDESGLRGGDGLPGTVIYSERTGSLISVWASRSGVWTSAYGLNEDARLARASLSAVEFKPFGNGDKQIIFTSRPPPASPGPGRRAI